MHHLFNKQRIFCKYRKLVHQPAKSIWQTRTITNSKTVCSYKSRWYFTSRPHNDQKNLLTNVELHIIQERSFKMKRTSFKKDEVVEKNEENEYEQEEHKDGTIREKAANRLLAFEEKVKRFFRLYLLFAVIVHLTYYCIFLGITWNLDRRNIVDFHRFFDINAYSIRRKQDLRKKEQEKRNNAKNEEELQRAEDWGRLMHNLTDYKSDAKPNTFMTASGVLQLTTPARFVITAVTCIIWVKKFKKLGYFKIRD